MIPSHIIQQKADRNRYCNSATTSPQLSFIKGVQMTDLTDVTSDTYFASVAKLNPKHKDHISQ